jgi:hypothetical protein
MYTSGDKLNHTVICKDHIQSESGFTIYKTKITGRSEKYLEFGFNGESKIVNEYLLDIYGRGMIFEEFIYPKTDDGYVQLVTKLKILTNDMYDKLYEFNAKEN